MLPLPSNPHKHHGLSCEGRVETFLCCRIPGNRVCVQVLQEPPMEITQGGLAEVPLVKCPWVLPRFQLSLLCRGFSWLLWAGGLLFILLHPGGVGALSASVTLCREPALGLLRLQGCPALPQLPGVGAALPGEQGTSTGALLRGCCSKTELGPWWVLCISLKCRNKHSGVSSLDLEISNKLTVGCSFFLPLSRECSMAVTPHTVITLMVHRSNQIEGHTEKHWEDLKL